MVAFPKYDGIAVTDFDGIAMTDFVFCLRLDSHLTAP
jgi:hypothetical protein